jgi:hypothetical protein
LKVLLLVQPFELRRWDPQRLMEPGVVEPADVFGDGELELSTRAPEAIGDQLGLEAVDEQFGERMSKAVKGQHESPLIAKRLMSALLKVVSNKGVDWFPLFI